MQRLSDKHKLRITMKNAATLFIITCITVSYGYSQARLTDSIAAVKLEEVVVTATRTEKQLGTLTTPVTLITQKQIKALGAVRLTEVLQEQTGLAINNDHGQGIQMQGFDADYTLIMIDGEPLIGRTAGTLALSRIAVNNIKQIEIVKGPSSSLYGSEALAGVINIITHQPKDDLNGGVNVQYGANQTFNVNGKVGFRHKKLAVSLFADSYQSAGYDLTPTMEGATVEPFRNHTFQAKLQYKLNPKFKFSLSGRYFGESQQQKANIGSNSPVIVSGDGTQTDMNIHAVAEHKLTPNVQFKYKLYHTQYSTRSLLRYEQDQSVYDESFFKQKFSRPEVVANYYINKQHFLTLGIGSTLESVEATRYTTQQRFSTLYAFGQHEWTPIKKLSVITGLRFDQHSVYGNQVSPKLSARFQALPWLAVRGSAGVGFKAPDFRQLYLNFSNAVAGYSVFGTQALATGIEQLNSAGQISAVFADISQFQDLKPESSIAYNIGIETRWKSGLNTSINFFRNDVQNLIETQIVARKTNSQSVFSYANLREVFTQGVEFNGSYRLFKNVKLMAGYQYLIAKDKSVVDQLNNGEVFKRDPQTLVTTRVRPAEYGGLFNRSRHMWNVRLFYEHLRKGFNASLRGIYRGRYGLADMNNNQILDTDNEYVAGYWLWNASLSQRLYKELRAQIGVDNLFGFKNATEIPGIAGRLWYIRVSYQWQKSAPGKTL